MEEKERPENKFNDTVNHSSKGTVKKLKLVPLIAVSVAAAAITIASLIFIFSGSDNNGINSPLNDNENAKSNDHSGKDDHTHSFCNWTITNNATCKDVGEESRFCECGEIEKRKIDKTTTHTEVVDLAVEPTTTTAGLTEGSHCSVCGKILLAQNIIPAIVEKIDFDEMVKKYSGTWYLDGYSDIYIVVYRSDYKSILMEGYGISFPVDYFTSEPALDAYTKYPFKYPEYTYCHSMEIPFEDWNFWIEKKDVSFENDSIFLGNNEFVKNKGEKDKYDGSFCKLALGTWYLQYNSNVVITIEKIGGNETSGDYYGIKTHNFNLETSANDKNDYATITAAIIDDWNQFGIFVEDETLTVTNENGTCVFYKTPTYKQVTGITLDKQELSLTIGETQLLKATVSPSDAYDTTFNWSSSNSSVATVSASGFITAKGEGTAIISAITSDGNHIATCEVSVTAVHVTGITISQSSLEMIVGATSQLTATVIPNNATNKSVIWSSSDDSVAQVSSTGQVKAIGKGVATITVTSIDGEYSQICTVTIKEPELKVDISMGVGYYMSDTSYVQGVFVEISASGGSGFYTDYYIKLYYNGNLVAEVAKDEVVVAPILSGTYTAEVYVKDSSGNEVTATKTNYIIK